MLKKYLYGCLLAALTLLTYSCSKKDLGNYNYHDINEVKFSTALLNGKITAYTLTQLKINPNVEFTQDKAIADPKRYSYEWVYVAPTGSQEGAGIKTLATTKDLDIFMNLSPNVYDAYYKVTDNVTGVKFSKKFLLEVRNEFNEGWLLLTDVNGQARLDMLSKQVNNEFITVNDLLGHTKSDLKLSGKPKLVYSYNCGKLNGFGINLPYALYLATDQCADRVNAETFAWQINYNVTREIMNPDVLANFTIDAVQRVRGDNTLTYMLSSVGDVYFSSSAQQVKYSMPLNYDNANTPYKVAPFIGASESYISGPVPSAYFYDMTNRRFLKHSNAFQPKLLTMPEPTGSQPKLFTYNNTGKDLLYMSVAKNIQVHAILKDPVTMKIYLAVFNGTNDIQVNYKEIIATDLDKAEHFAISPLFGYIYYNVGGKLYQYDYNTATPTCKLVLDKGAAKISALKFQTYHNTVKYPASEAEKLQVCSYDPALPEDQNGKLEQFNILNGAAGLSATLNTYTGFGKVVSLHYRER